MPEAAVTAFTVRFAVRDVLDTLTQLHRLRHESAVDSAEVRLLERQLRTELDLLERALARVGA